MSELSFASPCPSNDVTVLFPTPPLPERMRILCFTLDRRFFMSSIAGSGPAGTPVV